MALDTPAEESDRQLEVSGSRSAVADTPPVAESGSAVAGTPPRGSARVQSGGVTFFYYNMGPHMSMTHTTVAAKYFPQVLWLQLANRDHLRIATMLPLVLP